ncbi:hypothetical protein AB0K00_26900 [Dactylosporangium sp. NPDC049525]|uniref:hypothetical protein n=1 Tax=Dactylosporangium sp. NPDC049525 TaxID=3154730 RepID=UPI00341DA50F
MTDEGADPAMAEGTLFTFAELEFLLRSAGAQPADAVRERLNLQSEASSDIVVASGMASLLARGLCTEVNGDVVPGDLVVAAIAALSTRHTVSEAAGWIDGRPVVVHLFSGTAARIAVYPGSFGLYRVEAVDPAEPLARPLVRFLDLCTAGDGEAAVLFRSTAGDGPEVGVAAARNAEGTWLLSDTADSPDVGRPSSRDAIAARLEELFGEKVGV